MSDALLETLLTPCLCCVSSGLHCFKRDDKETLLFGEVSQRAPPRVCAASWSQAHFCAALPQERGMILLESISDIHIKPEERRCFAFKAAGKEHVLVTKFDRVIPSVEPVSLCAGASVSPARAGRARMRHVGKGCRRRASRFVELSVLLGFALLELLSCGLQS